MRPITPGMVAAWVLVALLAFGPPLALPEISLPWLPSIASGPRHLLIVRESADDTPAIARVLANLRDGQVAQQLAAAGHVLTVLDDDDRDATGQPVPLLEKFKPFTPPELLVLTKEGERLVRRQKLPDSAAAVLEAAQ